jgi:hypothetical protein
LQTDHVSHATVMSAGSAQLGRGIKMCTGIYGQLLTSSMTTPSEASLPQ